MWKNNGYYRIISDHLGSARLVIKTDGTIAQRLSYDAFGNVLQNTSPGFQCFGFAGGLFDEDTKLTRFGARDYDAKTGRWTTKEPLGFAGSNNFYSYCSNNPVILLDPTGLDVWVYNYRSGADEWGHVGLIMPNPDGTFTRYSQGADDPEAPIWQLLLWQRDAKVNIKEIPSLNMPGAQLVRIPIECNDQIKAAITEYIKDNDKYHVIGNNCADFVNDVLNSADDLNLSDHTIPNDYMDMLIKKYGLYKP